MTNIAELESRLARGDAYLQNNPNDAEAKALYFRLWGELMALQTAEASRLVAVLEHPQWTTEDGGHTIRVCIDGARHEGELDKEDLSVLNVALAEGR